MSQRLLHKNQREANESLADHRSCREELQQEIELLIQGGQEKKKAFKRRLDQRWKDLWKVEEVLSKQERLMGNSGEHSSIGDEPHSGPDGPDAIVGRVIAKVAQDTGVPLSSDAQGAVAAAPGEVMERPMDVDDPQSPITASDDAVLSGTREAGIEEEMATLQVTSTPERCEDDEGEASS